MKQSSGGRIYTRWPEDKGSVNTFGLDFKRQVFILALEFCLDWETPPDWF